MGRYVDRRVGHFGRPVRLCQESMITVSVRLKYAGAYLSLA